MTNYVEGTGTLRKVKEEGRRFDKRDIGECLRKEDVDTKRINGSG